MTITKFEIKLSEQYILELFGSPQVKDPLLTKNLSQKVKYNLKKLGVAIQTEYKAAVEQLREVFNKYSEDVPIEPLPEGEQPKDDIHASKPKKRIKEEFREQYEKESKEIEDMEVEIPHYSFTEKDFIDHSTGDIVAGDIYYNIIDKLVYEKLDEEAETKA